MAIEMVGGPETMDPFNLADAVRSGGIEMAWISSAYYMPELPEAAVFDYSELTAEEERESGALEYVDEIHRDRMNVHVLGRGSWGAVYSTYTNEAIESVDDFQGLRLRVSPVYVPFVEALGAEPVTMPGGEIYTALERGVIDGFTWPDAGITALQLHEIVDYQVLPTFWSVDIISMINLDRWNQLSEAQQAVLTEAAIAVEEQTPEAYEQLREDEASELDEAGVERIELEDDEAERYLELAQQSAWDWVRENVQQDPEELIDRFSDN
jgi:TRAP-type transport system periplasmic protein